MSSESLSGAGEKPGKLIAFPRRSLANRRAAELEFLPGALIIGIKFTECFNTDPLLPPELLPRPWPGRTARDILVRCRRLGILLREEHGKPQLFAPLDELLGNLV